MGPATLAGMSSDARRDSTAKVRDGFAISGTFAPKVTIEGGAAAAMLLGGLALVGATVIAVTALRSRRRPPGPPRLPAEPPHRPEA